jgi:NhaA family Na+:H+ antiporter
MTRIFLRFVRAEQAGGFLLLVCTLSALAIANSPAGGAYTELLHVHVGILSLEHWINDGLMALFFLLVGLELERELYVGELSEPKKALLPLFAAAGGMAAPAAIHWIVNAGTDSQPGFGIPMATDIAFALAVLSVFGNRIPPALKLFVVAFAVADDLGAVVLIAAVYTPQVHLGFLAGAAGVFAVLVILNRAGRVMSTWPYLLGGAVMWWCLLRAGVHASIAGVLLAFAVPFTSRDPSKASPSQALEQRLHAPVAFIVLPLFALANTAIVIDSVAMATLLGSNAIGIAAGLVLGKPLGVLLMTFIALKTRICRLPDGLGWWHIAGAGILGGIGFTMSIFISNLAFAADPGLVASSKLAVLVSSVIAATAGLLWFGLGRTQLRM